MKRLLITFAFVGIVFQAHSQKLATTSSELLKKSNDQYTAGWVLLGGGSAFLVTSWAITPNYDNYNGNSGQSIDSVLGLIGSLSILASIPVFLSAGNNGRMAARLALQNQALHQPFLPGQPRSFPSIGLKIPL